MSGLTDFVKYSWGSTVGRAKGIVRNPKDHWKGPVNPKRDLKWLGEDMDRLFVGAPDEPLAPEAPGKTLKAAESREPEEQAKRRRASLYSEPLGRKTVLGG